MKRILLVSCLLIAGCDNGDSYVRQVKSIEWFFSLGKTGGSRDWALVKTNVLGQRDPVGIIYGFMDDRAFCAEIAEMYNARYPGAKLHCEPMN
jgi:hypothetical protein